MPKSYQTDRHCVCLTDLKTSALLFDKVVPINVLDLARYGSIPVLTEEFSIEDLIKFMNRLPYENLRENRHIVRELLFENGDVDESFLDYTLEELASATIAVQSVYRRTEQTAFFNASYVLPIYHKYQQELTAKSILNDEDTMVHNTKAIQLITQVLDLLKIPNPSFVLPKTSFETKNPFEDEIEVVISGLNLFDASRISWPTVMEIRRDQKSKQKLKNMRVSLFKDYGNSPKSYIEDSIMSSVRDFEETCKQFSIDTRQATISGLFRLNSATIATFVAAQVLGAANLPAALAASAVQFGDAYFNFSRSRRLHRRFVEKHPLSYVLHDLRNAEF